MTPTDKDETTVYAPVSRVVLPPQRRPSCLHLEQGPGAPTTITIDGERVVIGRSQRSEIRFSHESLSRQHALLRRRGVEYIIDDLDSHNGVFINGIRVHSVTLCHGDTVQLGDLVFRYEEGD